MVRVTVKQHNFSFTKSGHVNTVQLLYQGEDVILLEVDLKTKNKTIDAYGGATDENCQSIWIGGDEIQITLPDGFGHTTIFAETSRYTIHVCIFKYELAEKMVDSKYEDVVLWEAEN
jgi:hypothetical protein